MKKNILYTLVLTLAFNTPLLAFANESISLGAGWAGSDGTGCDSSCNYVASAFTPSVDGTISTITVKVRRTGTVSDNILVGIMADVSGHPSGTYISSGSVTGSTLSPTTVSDTVFNLSSPVSVTSGTTYWLVQGRDGTAGTPFYRIAFQTGGNNLKFDDDWSPTYDDELYGQMTVITEDTDPLGNPFTNIFGSASTTGSTTLSIVDNPVQDLFEGFILFTIGMALAWLIFQ